MTHRAGTSFNEKAGVKSYNLRFMDFQENRMDGLL